jgi:cytochrome c-type biogenesis protein CcmH/NrfG
MTREQSFARLAAGFVKANDWEGALAASEVVTRGDPTHFAGWVMRGMAQAKLKLYQEAVTSYRAALGVRPDDVSSWAALGELYIGLNDFKQAAEMLQKACELDPKGTHASGRRARALIGRTIALLRQKQKK